MRGCECELPRAHNKRPGFANDIESCRQCGKIIDPEITSNDETVSEFFSRLRETFPEQPEWLEAFEWICKTREFNGREEYGHRHLAQDSAADGMEEAADGALYAFFCLLRARRYDDEEEWGLALTAAHHFAEAYHALSYMGKNIPIGISHDPDQLP